MQWGFSGVLLLYRQLCLFAQQLLGIMIKNPGRKQNRTKKQKIQAKNDKNAINDISILISGQQNRWWVVSCVPAVSVRVSECGGLNGC